jgi:hypothetical protein
MPQITGLDCIRKKLRQAENPKRGSISQYIRTHQGEMVGLSATPADDALRKTQSGTLVSLEYGPINKTVSRSPFLPNKDPV